MAGVAYLLKQRGHCVSGCDKYATPRTEWLKRAGIAVAIGHAPLHLANADELVVTPAVPPSEPELRAALAAKLPIRRRGEVLAALVNATDGIAICGTHGKTTTAVFTAKLLHLLGDDPGWCIGGECGEWPVAAAGAGPLVVEADESDGTLALYRAQTLVITTMDYDHPEHFKTVEDYRACFAQAEAQSADVIHAWELDAGDWPELEMLVLGRHNVMNARAAIEVALRRGHAHEQIAAVLPQALSTLPDRRFQTIWPPTPQHSPSHLPTSSPSHLPTFPPSHLPTFPPSHLPTIVTDYAHHPAELACAVGMAKALKPKRLRVLFQPHRYSRTRALKDEFPAAFVAADEVVLIPVYPAFEEPILGGDIADLYAAFRILQNKNQYWPQGLRLARSAEEAWKHVFLTLEPGDLILLAGAGDIINLTPRILSDMGTVPKDGEKVGRSEGEGIVPNKVKKEHKNLSVFSFYKTGGVTYGGGEHFYLGMGSNVWFSDCATDIELVTAPKTFPPSHLPTSSPSHLLTFPAGLPGSQLLPDHPELAFMAGIPGTVGGWTKMNAGAFGDSFGNHLESVFVQDETGVIRKISAEECDFSYRHSKISGLIVAVTLKPYSLPPHLPTSSPSHLPTSSPSHLPTFPSINDYLAKRKKFPPRTCGSVFKNPSPDRPAGRLLEEAGAKEFRVGGAYVWQEHANVIVAGEGATSSDILALARLMAVAVLHRFGIALQPEVRGLAGLQDARD